jgi:hypothetical protein
VRHLLWDLFVLAIAVCYLYGWYLVIRKAREQRRRILPLVVASLFLSPWLILIAIRERPFSRAYPRIREGTRQPASLLLAPLEGVRYHNKA